MLILIRPMLVTKLKSLSHNLIQVALQVVWVVDVAPRVRPVREEQLLVTMSCILVKKYES